ncbi:hypothetical protein Adt_35088 [Abeliophyllum distichum]|uniref:Uncharacterized protein n=1 Tax=Abeliophyllum distichum TaxID=126358 RepID=A0ABD1QF14_9LAMI
MCWVGSVHICKSRDSSALRCPNLIRSICRRWIDCRLPWIVLLDNANAAQKVAAEALEAANQENRCLLDEVQNLRGDLESSENGRKEGEFEVARLMGEKKEMEEKLGKVEAKLENAEAEFVANFHNTEAYTNFLDYFPRVGQQEVPIVLRKDHPSFDIGPLEARFPPPDAESEEYS